VEVVEKAGRKILYADGAQDASALGRVGRKPGAGAEITAASSARTITTNGLKHSQSSQVK
jgi:hypothetical protein